MMTLLQKLQIRLALHNLQVLDDLEQRSEFLMISHGILTNLVQQWWFIHVIHWLHLQGIKVIAHNCSPMSYSSEQSKNVKGINGTVLFMHLVVIGNSPQGFFFYIEGLKQKKS